MRYNNVAICFQSQNNIQLHDIKIPRQRTVPRTSLRALCSTTSTGRLVLPLLRTNKACSVKLRLFSVLAPHWWNELPINVMTAEYSPSSAKDSRLLCSDFTFDPHIAWLFHTSHSWMLLWDRMQTAAFSVICSFETKPNPVLKTFSLTHDTT